MHLSKFVLLAVFAAPIAFAAQPARPKSVAVAAADPTFSRAAPLPKWAQPLADIPPTERTDPVVTRLAELQARAGATPSLLVNQAIQVNDPASLSDIGQYSLSYFPSYQKVLLHRVAIMRAGHVMDRTATVNVRLLERETGVDSGVYGGEKSVQLLLDDVRAGDTLWITYTVDGRNPVFGKRWAQDFSWDRDSPVELRRMTILHPPGQPVYWRQLGDVKAEPIVPVIDTVAGMTRMRFDSRAIDAVQAEPSIPPDFLPYRRLQLSEYPDWQSVALWADGLFPRAAPSPALKQLAARFATEKTRLAQASAALHWVQDEIRYFSVSIGENSHRPQAPDTVLARRYGDCKDKTYLLVSLLKQLGIDATPVLVNASAPKTPAKVMPSPTWFDHVIVRVDLDGESYFVDPTRRGQRGLLTVLPATLPGAAGLPASAAATALVTLPDDNDPSPWLEHIENIVVASFDGDATLEARLVYRGNYAELARRSFASMGAAVLKQQLLASYEKRYPGVTMVAPPTLLDDAGGGRYEVLARYKLPKPVTLDNGRYAIEYDSQIMDDTMVVPAKIVRSYPFRPPQGKFRGRYRLNLLWPTLVRSSDTPVMKTLDTPFFFASEEFTLRGNLVSYMLDYRVKTDEVAPEAMLELSKQARNLNPFAAGRWITNESKLAYPGTGSLPYREFEWTTDMHAVVDGAERMQKSKDFSMTQEQACEVGLRMARVAEAAEASFEGAVEGFSAKLVQGLAHPAPRRCLAQYLFKKGRFAESIALYPGANGLKDEDTLWPVLAWQRFHGGDAKAALADMARYRAARDKAGELDGFDIANHIALLQRMGAPVPGQLFAYGTDVPDGPWPRPLVAMQAGVLSEDALLARAAALPADARDIAFGEAWFFIGQRRMAAGDTALAQTAFRWLLGNGVRSSREYSLAKLELARLAPADAGRLIAAAAEAGDVAAMAELGRLLLRGSGVPVDKQLGIGWLDKAAQKGHAFAQYLLGLAYRDGDGVAGDPVKAIAWLEKSAANGFVYAYAVLGESLVIGKGMPVDRVRAVGLYRQGAMLGDAASQQLLGMSLHFGRGVTQDYVQAAEWYRKAGQQRMAVARNNLGDLYENGFGVPKDYARAIALYRQAAAAGASIGFISLATMYEQGWGVPADAQLAYTYMQLGVNGGGVIIKDPDTLARAKRLAALLSAQQRTDADAIAAAWTSGDPLPGDTVR
jgi:TPR repeat protein/transglutaminase-like putative cysteine protease